MKQNLNFKKVKIREIECRSAIGKCGFPGGGWAINPYIGCAHGCVYCYARFIKRFTGHAETWGSFVDIRVNVAEVLAKQIKSPKYHSGQIFIGTVTDPYQPLEEKYQLTRKILQVLLGYPVLVSILTKSALVLRDLDLLKKFKNIDVNFTINSLDEKWQKLVEPNSSTVEERLKAAKELVHTKIPVYAMMGPYWPVFTDPEKLLKRFKEVGISRVFSESFNAVGGNWTGVEKILGDFYPRLLPKIKSTILDKDNFYQFYEKEEKWLRQIAKEHHLPITIYFRPGHAGKFK